MGLASKPLWGFGHLSSEETVLRPKRIRVTSFLPCVISGAESHIVSETAGSHYPDSPFSLEIEPQIPNGRLATWNKGGSSQHPLQLCVAM